MLKLAQTEVGHHSLDSLVEHGAIPLACLIGFLVFIFLFKAPIKKLLSRATGLGVGPSGLSIDAQAEQASTGSTAGAVTGDSTGAASNPAAWRLQPDSPAVTVFEQSIQNDLSTKFAQDPDSRKKERLINNLAHAQLALVFEKNYRVIYNSQIQFLRFLNQNAGGLSVDAAKQYYGAYCENVPALKVLAFETWIQFLQGIAFVNFKNGNYQVGQLGQEFLHWLIRAQIRDDRPY